MSNSLINKFKQINDSRERLKDILEYKGVTPANNSLAGLVETVNLLNKNTTSVSENDWNGIPEESLVEPEEYYKPELDLDTIVTSDAHYNNYDTAVLFLIDVDEFSGNVVTNTFAGFSHYKYSDSVSIYSANTSSSYKQYGYNTAHNWNANNDIISTSGKHYRWVIGYKNNSNTTISSTAGMWYDPEYVTVSAIIAYKGIAYDFRYGTFR